MLPAINREAWRIKNATGLQVLCPPHECLRVKTFVVVGCAVTLCYPGEVMYGRPC